MLSTRAFFPGVGPIFFLTRYNLSSLTRVFSDVENKENVTPKTTTGACAHSRRSSPRKSLAHHHTRPALAPLQLYSLVRTVRALLAAILAFDWLFSSFGLAAVAECS